MNARPGSMRCHCLLSGLHASSMCCFVLAVSSASGKSIMPSSPMYTSATGKTTMSWVCRRLSTPSRTTSAFVHSRKSADSVLPTWRTEGLPYFKRVNPMYLSNRGSQNALLWVSPGASIWGARIGALQRTPSAEKATAISCARKNILYLRAGSGSRMSLITPAPCGP